MNELAALAIDGERYPVEASELTWRPGVYGIVIDDGKILLSPQHGFGYDLPGGGMEFGEDFEQTVIREVKEETGIDVQPDKLLEIDTNLFVWEPNNPLKRKTMQSLMFYYQCYPTGGVLSTEGFDDEEKSYAGMAEWVELSRLNEIKIASTIDFRPIVRRLIHGN